MLIVIIDESKNALKSDHSNINLDSDRDISQADLVIKITPDKYIQTSGRIDSDTIVEYVEPVSEAALSSMKSKEQEALRNSKRHEKPKSEEEMKQVIEERLLRSFSSTHQEEKPRDFEF